MQRLLLSIFLNDFLSFPVISIKWGIGSLVLDCTAKPSAPCFPTAYVRTTYFNRMRLTAKQRIYSNNKTNPSNNSALQDPAWIWRGDYFHFFRSIRILSEVPGFISCWWECQLLSREAPHVIEKLHLTSDTDRNAHRERSWNGVQKSLLRMNPFITMDPSCIINWFKMLPIRNLHV